MTSSSSMSALTLGGASGLSLNDAISLVDAARSHRPLWALERAAAQAEVEPDEMTGLTCVHAECRKYDDGACWYGPDDPRRWLPRRHDF